MKTYSILLAIVTAVAFLWMGDGIVASAPRDPGAGPELAAADARVGFGANPIAGLVREVTAYNVGVREQTSDDPCIGATGEDLCRLVAQGLKVCAANFVDPKTVLLIEGYGECVVLDRMNRRYSERVDIAMSEDEIDRAVEFGLQRRLVVVKYESH